MSVTAEIQTSTVREILLRRRNKLLLEKNSSAQQITPTQNIYAIVTAAARNIESMGYEFSPQLVSLLWTKPETELKSILMELIENLKALTGADKQYNPMYPNFPKQVADADDVELYFNAMLHYVTNGNVRPAYQKEDRFPLYDDVALKSIEIGTKEEVMEIFTNLISSKTSLSAQDKSDVATVIQDCYDFYDYLPDTIPLKENVALLGYLILKETPEKSAKPIQKYFKTATDVLRLVTLLCGGDVSLSVRTKYAHMRRCERRMVMDLLAGCGNILEDMYRYQFEWIKVGEVIHPFEYRDKKYKNVCDAFDKIRNQKKPLFVPGQIELAIQNHDIATAVDLLKSRPGEFARRLDTLLRYTTDKNYVLNSFSAVADEVSVPVLLQVAQHFADRNKKNPVRVFFPKGVSAKAVSIKNELPPLNQKICDTVTEICSDALKRQFSHKDYMGKVYIDDDFVNYTVPFSQRAANAGNKCLTRGSRIAINPNAKAVRGFIWWTNLTNESDERYTMIDDEASYFNRVDIDLSAALYDDNWNLRNYVSFTNLRSKEHNMFHSGDIIDGGPLDGAGACEFIDFDLEYAVKGARYVVFEVYVYGGPSFQNIPHCHFGWMERGDVDSGEIFEPSTVETLIKLNANSRIAIPVIFDCVTKEFIWCDLACSKGIYNSSYAFLDDNMLETNLKGVTAACYAMTHLSKPNLYTLVALNAAARGRLVNNPQEADIIFSNRTNLIKDAQNKEDSQARTVPQIVTSYDLDYYMGQMM